MYIYEIRDLVSNLPIHRKICIRHLSGLSILLCLIFCVGPLHAQIYEYGQDAGSLKWKQFTSSHYKLIYPRELDSLAMSFADKLEYYYPFQAEVLQHEHKTMPVVIHNEASFSNGVFVWAPRRLEIFTNPDPNGFPQDWLLQLALHEGRHAFQISKLNQGLTKGLSFIAGEQAMGIAAAMMPVWYLEGDAVDAETRFSNSGRGRLPSFEMGMKALLLESGERYSFSKAILGSFRDYVPNHYELGYLMVRYGRRTYGDLFWTDMEDMIARRPYLLNPSYFSMKKYGISSKKSFYASSLDHYENHWKSNFESRHIQATSRWSPVTGHYTSYNFPQWINDSLMIALKTGVDVIPAFVTIVAGGAEEKIFRPGFLNSGRFSYAAGKIVWDEWVADLRWSNRSYSVIKILDLESRKLKQLGVRTRYYSPALSKSGRQIVAVEQNANQTFNLVLMDSKGEEIRKVASPQNKYIQQAQWMEEDSAIVVCLNDQEGEHLYIYSLISSDWKEIYQAGFDDISYPIVAGNDLYFSSTRSGINNIYRLKLTDGELSQLTFSAFGAFEAAVSSDKQRLLFSDYHAGGYQSHFVEIQEREVEVSRRTDPGFEQLDAKASGRERSIIDSSAYMPAGTYTPRPYSKILHAVNIHSWLPLYFDYMNPEAALTPDEFPLKLGATILSQNLLSTVSGMLAYEYKDKMHYLHSGIRLKGRYPIVDLSINYGGLPQIALLSGIEDVPLEPNRFTFRADTYIPFRLNTGKFITFIQPLFAYSYSSDLLPDVDQNAYEKGIHKMHYRAYFSSYLRRGTKDILPRLGFVAYAGYQHAPLNAHNFGDQSYAVFSAYLPGLFKHQAMRLRYAFQKQEPEHFFFANLIPAPRGHEMILGLKMSYFSADYTLPLAYPDLSIEPLIYIKRIRANLWTDFMQGRDVLFRQPLRYEDASYFSCGADLIFDFHPLRLYFPFSMGVRAAYLPQTGKLTPELLFTIDVN